MEPFGLLQLLKNLLPNEKDAAEKPAEPNGEPAPSAAVQTDVFPASNEENFTASPDKREDKNADETCTSNAFLDFAKRHDARAKQIKKP